jgi:DNA repair protein RecO
MHRVFMTEGIVLGKRAAGEENILAAILTRDLGYVRASVRAARRENSKLRYGVEALSRGRYSLIRGKHEWKLTSAMDVSHELIAKETSQRQAVGRVARLLTRLIQGEDPNADLYDTVSQGLLALARGANVEVVLVLRILSHLGYLPHKKELEPFIEKDFFSHELESEIAASRTLLIRAINDSLSATGL